MTTPSALSNDHFSETVFELADEVGSEPVWDLLVHAGVDLPQAARDRAEKTGESAWESFAAFLERAIAHTSPSSVWKQLRSTLRVYDAYGVDQMSPEERREMSPGDEKPVDLEAPSPVEAQFMACPACEHESFLVVLYRPAAVLGQCAQCGNGAESAEELEARRISPEFDALLGERRETVETLYRTRATIEEFEGDGRFENALKLVPLYRLEARHMRRIRELTARLTRVMSDEEERSARG